MPIKECDHPLIQHKLSYLRQPKEIIHFRDYERLIYEMGLLLAFEVTYSLETTDIDTNRQTNGRNWRAGQKLKKKPVLIPIVRSGLILADAMRSVIPTPHMGHIGIFDDPHTQEPKEFMVTMPERLEERPFIILDLFVDRGKTSRHAVTILTEYGIDPKDISFVSLIISKEGHDEVLKEPGYDAVQFFCGRLDDPRDRWLPDYQKTNERLFRTKNRPQSQKRRTL